MFKVFPAVENQFVIFHFRTSGLKGFGKAPFLVCTGVEDQFLFAVSQQPEKLNTYVRC